MSSRKNTALIVVAALVAFEGLDPRIALSATSTGPELVSIESVDHGHEYGISYRLNAPGPSNLAFHVTATENNNNVAGLVVEINEIGKKAKQRVSWDFGEVPIRLDLNGSEFNDRFEVKTSQLARLGDGYFQYRVTAQMRGGNDRLQIGKFSQIGIAEGEAGNDTMYGGNSNDMLSGGEGNDWMSGGDGDDYMRGGSGKNEMRGGNGNDFFSYYFNVAWPQYNDLDANKDIISGDAGYDRVQIGYGEGEVNYLPIAFQHFSHSFVSASTEDVTFSLLTKG